MHEETSKKGDVEITDVWGVESAFFPDPCDTRKYSCCWKAFVGSKIGEFVPDGLRFGTSVAFENQYECLCLRGLRPVMETEMQPGNGLLAPPVKKGIEHVRKCFFENHTQDYGR
ncbi:hypothetical protein [uncultured Gimesia sp.]|uniref:hypothetical protein n=1 Tax=uncultured Gimesia sp. TaxID=1678688 RepID=UPI0030D9405E